MSKITDIDKRIIDGVIDLIDWDNIIKFYKIMNRKIGYEQLKIKGISKNSKITIEFAKEELIRVIEYVIENDLTELSYGPWLLLWINGEWETMEMINPDTEEPMEELSIPIMESKLQVLFIPQSVSMKEDIDIPLDDFQLEGGLVLEDKLQESIQNEDYVLAGKLRDVIEELNKKRK